jgi:hypothetical protein
MQPDTIIIRVIINDGPLDAVGTGPPEVGSSVPDRTVVLPPVTSACDVQSWYPESLSSTVYVPAGTSITAGVIPLYWSSRKIWTFVGAEDMSRDPFA